MLRTSLGSLLGAVVAVTLAWRLGGVQGGGVLAGYFGGAGVTGLGLLYQRHTLQFRPKQAFAALGVSFGAKLVLLVAGVLAFRFVDAAAERVDWKVFLLAYAGAIALLLPFGVWDLARTPRAGAPRGDATTDRSSNSEVPCGSS